MMPFPFNLDFSHVHVLLQGRLGNQMFEYAAAHAVAKRLNLKVACYKRTYPHLLDCWSLRDVDIRGGCGIFHHPQFRIPKALIAAFLAQQNRYFKDAYDKVPDNKGRGGKYQSLGRGALIVGCVQNQKYFIDVVDDIRKIYRPSSPLSPIAKEHLAVIRGNPRSVAIHIRGDDYLQDYWLALMGRCDGAYYTRAMTHMESILGFHPKYFVFTDDNKATNEIIASLPERLKRGISIVSDGRTAPWEDMVLMSHCRHHIISNSTFAWWGAWLNTNADARVIGPDPWYRGGEKKHTSCMPDHWIKMA